MCYSRESLPFAFPCVSVNFWWQASLVCLCYIDIVVMVAFFFLGGGGGELLTRVTVPFWLPQNIAEWNIQARKRGQRLSFWVRRPPGEVGVFHAKGWWPESSCPPSKVCLPWVSK